MSAIERLVERLHERETIGYYDDGYASISSCGKLTASRPSTPMTRPFNRDGNEAADTILALARQCEGMRKTLGVFADALDEADNIIAVNCGTDTPKEWDRAYKRCAKARATLPDEVGK